MCSWVERSAWTKVPRAALPSDTITTLITRISGMLITRISDILITELVSARLHIPFLIFFNTNKLNNADNPSNLATMHHYLLQEWLWWQASLILIILIARRYQNSLPKTAAKHVDNDDLKYPIPPPPSLSLSLSHTDTHTPPISPIHHDMPQYTMICLPGNTTIGPIPPVPQWITLCSQCISFRYQYPMPDFPYEYTCPIFRIYTIWLILSLFFIKFYFW